MALWFGPSHCWRWQYRHWPEWQTDQEELWNILNPCHLMVRLRQELPVVSPIAQLSLIRRW